MDQGGVGFTFLKVDPTICLRGQNLKCWLILTVASISSLMIGIIVGTSKDFIKYLPLHTLTMYDCTGTHDTVKPPDSNADIQNHISWIKT